MLECNRIEPWLLPYLYDALDEEARVAVEAHLPGCAACQAALEIARDQSQLLAAAAKIASPGAPFTEPAETPTPPAPVQPAAPATAPTPGERRRRLALVSPLMRIAAAVFLAAGGLAGALAWQHRTNLVDAIETVDRDLALLKVQHARELASVRESNQAAAAVVRQADAQLESLVASWKLKEQDIRETHLARESNVNLVGPSQYQPAGQNGYQINGDFSSRNPRVFNNDIQVRAYDPASNITLHEQTLNPRQQTNVQFNLPNNLPVKPGSKLALELQMLHDDNRRIRTTESFALDAGAHLTHLATDRTVYHPGEVVRFRSLTLDRVTFAPVHSKLSLRFRVIGPDGNECFRREVLAEPRRDGQTVRGDDGQVLHGVGVGEFTLPRDAHGVYELRVEEMNGRATSAMRRILVEHAASPRYKSEINVTVNNGYGVARGETLVTLETRPLASGQLEYEVELLPVPPAQVAFMLAQDDELQTKPPMVLSYPMSTTFPNRKASPSRTAVQATILDGDYRETVTGELIQNSDNVRLDFYPEGGQLVAGVSCRVYFRATLNGLPIDVGGAIRDEAAGDVAKFASDGAKTGQVGLGVFTITPKANTRLQARIDAPKASSGRTHLLPTVADEGYGLHVANSLVQKEAAAELRNQTALHRTMIAAAYCRGKLVDMAVAQIPPGQRQKVALKLGDLGGVHHLVAFVQDKEQLTPVAERLIMQQSATRVHTSIKPARASYAGGDTVTLKLEARTESGSLARGQALVAVVDEADWQRSRTRGALALNDYLLFASELPAPENYYGLEGVSQARQPNPAAVDLLLGVQRLRPFASPVDAPAPPAPQISPSQQAPPSPEAQVDGRARYLTNEANRLVPVDLARHLTPIDLAMVPKFIALNQALARAQQELGALPAETAVLTSQNSQMDHLQSQAQNAATVLAEFDRTLRDAATAACMLVALFVIGVLLRAALRCEIEERSGRLFLLLAIGLYTELLLAAIMGIVSLPSDADRTHRLTSVSRPEAEALNTTPLAVVELPAQPPAVPESADKDKAREQREQARREDPATAAQPVLYRLRPMGKPASSAPDYREVIRERLGRPAAMPEAEEPGELKPHAYDMNQAAPATPATLLWQPLVPLRKGRAEVSFDLPPGPRNLRVIVLTNTADGRLGTDTLPLAVTQREPTPPTK